ncbi:MAG: LPS export ABC transporter periplasmic protein LptC [Acidobacteria bacterium]|nr:MAG: LPS export ABC transporter periplasmic protein LptC [Acidobacteriota bacterium]
MTLWQRRLRLGLGVFIVLFAAGLFFSLRKPAPRADPRPSPAAADPKSVAQFVSGVLTHAKGTRQQYDVHYDQLLTYQDGRSRFVGVRLRIPDREGREFRISAREAEATSGESEVVLRGDVAVSGSDGLEIRAAEAFYQAADGVVRAPGEVLFSKGRMSGSSVGMTFNREQDLLTLLDRVRLTVAAGGEEDAEPATIEAGTGVLARRDKQVRLDRAVKIVREAGTLEADQAVGYLTDDEQQLKALELRGSARMTGAPGAAGGMRAMTARDMDLAYGPDGRTLERALLVSNASIELSGEAAGPGRRVAADRLEITLAPDGTTVTGLDGDARVRVDLPAAAETPTRVVTARQLRGRGTPEAGLKSAVFTDEVVFTETGARGTADRTARSARMELALTNGFDRIDSAQFGGGVTFDEGTMTAASRDARYDLERRLLLLSGTDARTGRLPRVRDERATIEAPKIDIGLEGRRIKAAGGVKSELRPEASGAKGAATPARAPKADEAGEKRLPSLLKKDQPVSATADALAYDGADSRLVYTGRAQLWQGDTSVKGDEVTLDDRKGDLTATGQVVTRMLLEQVNDKTKAREKVSSLATSARLVYEEEGRKATYSDDARMNGPQGDLHAATIELFLSEEGNEVTRLEAYSGSSPGSAAAVTPAPATAAGGVSIKTTDGRRATGLRLTYFAADERYVMTGLPVKIEEECRETTGRTLTFFKSADRIIVDGNERKRTEVKGGATPCSGPRLD